VARRARAVVEGMTDEQRLYPEAVYALNRALGEDLIHWLGKDLLPASSLVACSLFDKRSRAFHWLGVHSDRWAFGPRFKPETIRQAAGKAGEPDWEAYCWELDHTGLEPIQTAMKRIREYLTTPRRLSAEEAVRLHRALLAVYTGYPLPPRLFLDGILYRNLESLKPRAGGPSITWARGRLLVDVPAHHDHAWTEMTFYAEEGGVERELARLPRYQCQEALAAEERIEDIAKPEKMTDLRSYQAASNILKAVFPRRAVLRRRDREDGAPSGDVAEDRAVGSGGNDFMLVPLYDTQVDGAPAGGLWGVLYVFFGADGAMDPAERLARRLQEYVPRLVRELNESAWASILREAIQPPGDLVEHFVKHLVLLEDWDEVTVYRREGGNHRPLYCYRGRDADSGVRDGWQSCKDQNRWSSEHTCRSWSEAKTAERAGEVITWDTRVLEAALPSELLEAEGLGLRDVAVAFWYPSTAVVPCESASRTALGTWYRRQHLELLRDLAPKVIARRSAVRTAAVSIMARNMSHNIGSHVLARLASMGREALLEQLARLDGPDGRPGDALQHLLRHLQERMDFLAEVSTTASFLSLPLLIRRDVVSTFQQEQVLLLEHIAGIDGVSVELQVENPRVEDQRFAAPGGRMAAQALYVVIENLIRNAAKHGDMPVPETIALHLRFVTEPRDDDLIELVVWDTRGTAHASVPADPGEAPVSVVKYLSSVMKDAIIDTNGEVRPKNWGMRELTICCAYLRGQPVEDLERVQSPPLLQPVPVDDEGSVCDCRRSAAGTTEAPSCRHHDLGYRFFVRRVKDLVVAAGGDADRQGVASHAADLRRSGIDVVEGFRPGAKCLADVVDHAFGIWLEPNADDYESSARRLPLRLFVPEGTPDFPGLPRLCGTDLSDVRALLDFSGERRDGARMAVPQLVARLWRLWLEFLWQREAPAEPLPDIEIKPAVARESLDSWLPEKRKVALYQHHGDWMRQYVDKDPPTNLLFWEVYERNFAQASLLDAPPAEEAEAGGDGRAGHVSAFRLQLLEAALARVAVIDERIQAIARSEKSKVAAIDDLDLRAVLRRMRVEVPGKDVGGCDLDRPNAVRIGAWIERCERLDFVVIHQGILDRLGDRHAARARAWCANVGAHLVICSGRGVPSMVSDRFVPLSSVLRWTVQNPSKFHLVQLLFASRAARS